MARPTISPLEQEISHQPGEVSHVVEHLFRHEGGKMVATLTRIFGLEHLTLAEDVVQEALARAMQTWAFRGVPANPAAWIMRASKNLALDHIRRQKVFREKEPEIISLMEPDNGTPGAPAENELGIADDRLRMMFVCCHPVLAVETQVALALKVLGGFSPAEIAAAFLTSEAAIAKRLVRARQKLRDARIPFAIPEGDELDRRLDGVLQSLYLLFNEGYKASSGEKLVREEVCREAIRLTTLLLEHPAGRRPKVDALLALMLLNAARLPARADDGGGLLRLQDQDRSRWDQAMIAWGMFHLARSAAGAEASVYHLQAAIAAEHCRAGDYESTRWPVILELYNDLVRLDPSPVVALNRAVVVAMVHGPEAGLNAIAAIGDARTLETYYLLHAALGEFEWRRNHVETAAGHFRRALALTGLKSEQQFLQGRIHACEPAG